MADYNAAASSIYDPQAAAERTQAKTALDSSLSDISAAKADLQPYYSKAFSSLQTGEDKAQGQQIQQDNLAGLLDSGLHANQAAGITKDYATQRSDLATEQANKVANFDRQSQNAQSGYQAALSAILDKYNGMKAAYVQDALNKDADRAFQQRLADQSAALQREIAANSNASALKIANIQASSYNQKPTQQQELASAFSGYKSAKNGGQAFTLEQQIAPKIAADLGISMDQAKSIAYAYRKQVFGE